VRDDLERIRDETCADSLGEVVRRSLAVYDLLVAEAAAGAEVILRRDGERRVLLVP
jgi:hypothetical protein